jgi:hypothetical protein
MCHHVPCFQPLHRAPSADWPVPDGPVDADAPALGAPAADDDPLREDPLDGLRRRFPELSAEDIDPGTKLFHGFKKGAAALGIPGLADSVLAMGGVVPGPGMYGRGVYTYDSPENTIPYAFRVAGAFVAFVIDVAPHDDRVKHVSGHDHVYGKPIYLVETDAPLMPCGFVVVPAPSRK